MGVCEGSGDLGAERPGRGRLRAKYLRLRTILEAFYDVYAESIPKRVFLATPSSVQ